MSEISSVHVVSTTSTKQAWPFYIVCDVSQSMWDPAAWPTPATSPLGVMSDSLDLIYEELYEDEDASAIAHVGVIAFSGQADTHQALANLRERTMVGPLPKGNWTNYIAAWEHTNATIRADVERLKREGYYLKQPAVFFITDGQPGSAESGTTPLAEWKPVHDQLGDPAWQERPVIVALGMGEVDTGTLQHLRSVDPPGAACVGNKGESASTLLRAALKQILVSIRRSVGGGKFVFDAPPGWHRVDTP